MGLILCVLLPIFPGYTEKTEMFVIGNELPFLTFRLLLNSVMQYGYRELRTTNVKSWNSSHRMYWVCVRHHKWNMYWQRIL